jgi:hypothetical protein
LLPPAGFLPVGRGTLALWPWRRCQAAMRPAGTGRPVNEWVTIHGQSGAGRDVATATDGYSRASSSLGASGSTASQHVRPAAFARRTVSPTAPALPPRLSAICEWLRPSSHFCLRTSLTCRMDSRSAGMAPPSRCRLRGTIQRRQFLTGSNGAGGVITMADLGDHDADPGDHVAPIRAITFVRRTHCASCSRARPPSVAAGHARSRRVAARLVCECAERHGALELPAEVLGFEAPSGAASCDSTGAALPAAWRHPQGSKPASVACVAVLTPIADRRLSKIGSTSANREFRASRAPRVRRVLQRIWLAWTSRDHVPTDSAGFPQVMTARS